MQNCSSLYYFTISKRANQGDLWGAILGDGFTEAVCKDYFQQILQAVKFLQVHKVYHNDFKPDNIVLHKEEGHTKIYIIDFGNASVENAHSIPYRRYGTVSMICVVSFSFQYYVYNSQLFLFF